MKVIIELRLNRQTIRILRRLDRWLDLRLPRMLEVLGGVLFLMGIFVVIGVAGSVECDAPITWPLIRLGISGFAAAAIGGYVLANLERMEDEDEDYTRI